MIEAEHWEGMTMREDTMRVAVYALRAMLREAAERAGAARGNDLVWAAEAEAEADALRDALRTVERVAGGGKPLGW